MGMIAVLHTWGQNLSLHPHLHCIVPGGGVDESGAWKNIRSDGKFLFSVKALSKVFRAKFCEKLKANLKDKFNENQENEYEKIRQSLWEKPWVVYAKKHEGAEFLAQGTLYTDVIESVSVKGPSKTIKSHHNVGGLPDWMKFELVEPLREIFKDEVRELGLELGLPRNMINRHPFPGPGLAIRVMGDVNKPDLDLLRKADVILLDVLHSTGYYEKTCCTPKQQR